MDRTQQFRDFLNKATVSIPVSPNKNRKLNMPTRQMTDFFNHSKEINMRLQSTMAFIGELDELVNNENILNENNPRIQTLINQLQEQLKFIQNEIDKLENMPSTNGQAKSLAQSLKRNLLGITKTFQNLVKVSSDKMKTTYEQRKKIGYVHSQPSQFQTVYNNNDEIEFPIDQYSQVEMENLNERASLVQGVEQQTTAILKMFTDLSQIIADSNYSIVRIDDNTLEALNNMKAGQSQMEKYAEKVKNNKWFILKIFAVLFVFALIFILIV